MGQNLAFNLKEAASILFLFALIFCANLFISFKNYKDFTLKHRPFLNKVYVSKAYIKHKNNRTYKVLALKYKDFLIYTTTRKKLPLKQGDYLKLRVNTTRLSFLDYLSKSFYLPSYNYTVYSVKPSGIKAYFASEHKSEFMKELYGALYFASPIQKSLRQKIALFGSSHLIAISGYHLGLIFGILFFILRFIYSFFQARFFPFRDLKFDLSLIIFALLFIYASFLGFVPSFVRSLVMAIFAFFLLLKNIKLLSFSNLFFCVLLCVALYPRLLFSLGFFFSVLGVFYIFLYGKHFKLEGFFSFVFLNLYVFLAMIIPVHFFYPLASFFQFSSILLNLIFLVFYPFMFIMHLLGSGDLLDSVLLKALNLKLLSFEFFTPLWLFYLYLFLSFLSIFSKKFALSLVFLSLACFFYYAFF